MKQEILVKMQRGVYYPGNHLGRKKDLDNMVTDGFLERMLPRKTKKITSYRAYPHND
jgi:hypothetical protein